MRFKVGDKVMVRKGLVNGEYKGSLYVNDEMVLMSGETLTIKAIKLARERYTVEENQWDWNDEMLEEVSDLKPVDQVIEELEGERDAIKTKNKKAGQMIARGQLDQEQNYLLAAQKHGYDTVCHILDIRIRSLKKQVPVPEPEPKKYNVIAWVSPQDETKRSFWYRRALVQGELGASISSDNRDDDQQWTLAQIKEYGLEDCERIEVQDED